MKYTLIITNDLDHTKLIRPAEKIHTEADSIFDACKAHQKPDNEIMGVYEGHI